MDKLFQLLKDLIPLEIAALIVIFIYFLKAFREIAGEFVKISQQQVEYMRQRVESVDKTTTIFERTVEHQEKDLERLYEINEKLKSELEEGKEEAVTRLDTQLYEIVQSLEEVKKDKLSKEEFEKLKNEADTAKQNASSRYDEAIQSLSEIDIKSEVIPEKVKKVFMVFPFQKNELFDHIKTDLTKAGLQVYRADEALSPGMDISNNVRKCIDNSDIIIADLSGMNSSVMYELGYAHGHRKNVIALTNDRSSIPFDASNYRVILYEESIEGLKILSDRLKDTISKLDTQVQSTEQFKKIAKAVSQVTPYVGNVVRVLDRLL